MALTAKEDDGKLVFQAKLHVEKVMSWVESEGKIYADDPYEPCKTMFGMQGELLELPIEQG